MKDVIARYEGNINSSFDVILFLLKGSFLLLGGWSKIGIQKEKGEWDRTQDFRLVAMHSQHCQLLLLDNIEIRVSEGCTGRNEKQGKTKQH